MGQQGSRKDYTKRRLCSVDLKYFSGDQIKNEMDGACSRYGEEERCIKVLVGKLSGRRLLGRPNRRQKDHF
jgi:hypothetical protein